MRQTRCILAAFIFCSVCPGLQAAPGIQDVLGTLAHSEQITISGQNFGTKAQAAPLAFDDFEEGTIGQPLNWWYTSSTLRGYKPAYSDISSFSRGLHSRQAAYQHFVGGNYNATLKVPGIGDTGAAFKKIYISGWLYVADNAPNNPTRNTKLFGLRGPNGFPQGRFDRSFTASSGHKYTVDCDGTANSQDWGLGSSDISTGGEWWRVELWLDLGTPNGGDGVYQSRKNLAVWGSDLGPETMITSNCGFDHIVIQPYTATDTNNPDVEFWWDELYVDTTQARVEIGDAPTWRACTHREIQIPKAWSNDKITVQANLGSFPSGETVYLYVVDSAGSVNSNGYPVPTGGPADIPAAPAGLSITMK
jgi:hypothetical protein